MRQLTLFERAVLERVLNHEAPELLPQLDSLYVTFTKCTEIGRFVGLHIEGSYSANSEINKPLGRLLAGGHGEIGDFVRFNISVENGLITQIEMFANSGEHFPKNLDEIRLFYLK